MKKLVPPLAFLLLPTLGFAASFQPALPGYRFQFPRDDASHPAYATEWWYDTGHLRATDGHRFGYQLTFFRIGLTPEPIHRKSSWAMREVIMAHFAITDETTGRFYYCDRTARAAAGLAGAETKTPHVWVGDWDLLFAGAGQAIAARGQSLNEATGPSEMALTLINVATKPPAIHGQNGISQKAAGAGHASHYYSYTRLRSHGTLRLGSESFAVSGQSWFDHEFGSNQLSAGQVGWDWFSIQLDNGRELMLYRMRTSDGKTNPYSAGTLIARDGTTGHLQAADFVLQTLGTWHSESSGATYPARWRVSLPKQNMDLMIEPTVANQELHTQHSTQIDYWEGAVNVVGSQKGKPLKGTGYVELTGYAAPLTGTF